MTKINNINYSMNIGYKPVNFGNSTNPAIKVGVNTPEVPAKPDSGSKVLEYANAAYNQLALINDGPKIQTLKKHLDSEGMLLLYQVIKSRKLFSKDSDDGSSTLDNLCKIVKEPRLEIFDKKNVLKETLKTIADPYIITQNFGYIPENVISPETGFVNFSKGNTCPAASIEFDLADRRPAEFARYIAGLSGPEKSVKTKVKYTNLLPSVIDSVGVMAQQNTHFKPHDWQTAEVTIKPDDNAYIRANVQEDARQPATRSLVDVLMQSSLMQLGSRGTYNSITDTRSEETGNGKGLNQFEIAYVESIVDEKSRKMPIVYMELDDDATKILKYNYQPETTKKHLLAALDKGQNIITGFLVNIDNKGNVLSPDGHEILLTGYNYDENGKLWLKYNDSDDGDNFAPSWLDADSFIPTIHHANVPESVLNS